MGLEWIRKFMGKVKMKNKHIQNNILRLNFEKAFLELQECNYSFEFNELSLDFPKVDCLKMYLFLIYCIIKDEDIEKHFSICYYLYFMDPYIHDSDVIIKHHLLRILEISPKDKRVYENWILGIYNGNPNSPFTNEEIVVLFNKM